jgi:hypothetical protein
MSSAKERVKEWRKATAEQRQPYVAVGEALPKHSTWQRVVEYQETAILEIARRRATAGRCQQLTAVNDLSEDEVERHLAEQGIISIGAPLSAERASAQEFKPIQVTGKPISEMIVEERR